MSSIQSTASWKQLASTIRASTDRDLEIFLLPVLRAFWPALVRPRSLKHYDRAGVDLLAYSDDDGVALDVLIQCKGLFAAEGLTSSHVDQISSSIASFRKSPLICREYILIHNLDGRNRELAAKVDAELDVLVVEGKAKVVRQWDRDLLLRELESVLRERLRSRIYEQSMMLLSQIGGLFAQGSEFVDVVPVKSGTLRLRAGTAPQIIPSASSGGRAVNLGEEIGLPGAHRWTLLTGLFGSGKTSATLHAAAARPDGIIYVAAASIQPRRGEAGTNVVMSRILEALNVYSDEMEDEELLFRRLSGPILRAMLSSETSRETLIIDALDENRGLQSPSALTQFASSLAELRCNIVLTTRTEHFDATFGNFDHLFEGLSLKGGGIREIRMIELAPWGHEQVVRLVADATGRNPGNAGLAQLAEDIGRGGGGGWSWELLSHPFFLRMILDLVAEGGGPSDSRAGVLARWSRSKLWRDLAADRITPIDVTDRDDFVERAETFMSRVSGEMTAEDGVMRSLTETMSSTRVVQLGAEVFRRNTLDLGTSISVSLLVPVTARSRTVVPIRFSHRAFQEFYLARHIVGNDIDPGPYPEPVRELCAELLAIKPI